MRGESKSKQKAKQAKQSESQQLHRSNNLSMRSTLLSPPFRDMLSLRRFKSEIESLEAQIRQLREAADEAPKERLSLEEHNASEVFRTAVKDMKGSFEDSLE
jgi:primosomal protein N'